MRDDSAARYPPALLFTPFSPSYSPYTPVGSSTEIEGKRFFRSCYSLLNRKVSLEFSCFLPTVRRGRFPEPSAPVGMECLNQREQAWSRKATYGGFSSGLSFLCRRTGGEVKTKLFAVVSSALGKRKTFAAPLRSAPSPSSNARVRPAGFRFANCPRPRLRFACPSKGRLRGWYGV